MSSDVENELVSVLMFLFESILFVHVSCMRSL